VTHTLIYPHTTRHNLAGHLEIGGCDVVDLAHEYGTPLFIYDEQSVRDQCRAYHAAFGARTDLYEIV
jgi:diaminopimelate decarboxylase